MAYANMSSPFSAAIVNAIRTEYLETIDEYVIDYGAVVVCPPPTSRAFLRNFHPVLCQRWCGIWFTGSQLVDHPFSPHTSNAGQKFFISCNIASHQRVLPIYLSILTATFNVFGNLSQYLWVFTQYCWVLVIIWYLLFSKSLVHHENAGSSKILFSTAYSAICTGYESLIYLCFFM